jgi:S-adenosylmethionine:tRNA ribosyltransferase-isomerase
MKLEEFNYNLPEELIAQKPSILRDHSRMMVVDRNSGKIDHKSFYDLPEFLKKGDALVTNNSRVIPAKLTGKKATGGLVEMLLLSRNGGPLPDSQIWEVLLRPAKRVGIGTQIFFGNEGRAEVIERISEKKWYLKFETETKFDSFLERHGRTPLPPYIKRGKDENRSFEDIERYQTIYARVPGSVAAPTAGLHFSPQLLTTLKEKGFDIVSVTLHVGYGTFLSIETESVEDHSMEKEFFAVGAETARTINRAKRVVAVGTTSTRVLESVADDTGTIKQLSGHTALFIYPGYCFKRVDVLLTNFHLPKSSLLLLVCAFGGKDLMQEAYKKAIEEKYRFYSYGDCMLIL